MSDAIDDLIKEVMVKHNIVIGRDDPILILQTINARLLHDSEQAFAATLNHSKQEWAEMTLRWSQDHKDKAERLLNATLAASKDIMTTTFHEGATRIRYDIDAILKDVYAQQRKAYRFSLRSIIAAAITLLASTTIAWIILTHG